MKKRILSALLVAVMVISMLPATIFSVFAAGVAWAPGGGARWMNNGQHINVNSGYKPSYGIDENGRVYEVPKYVGNALNPARVAWTDYEDGIPTLYLSGAHLGKYDPDTFGTDFGGYSWNGPAMSGLANNDAYSSTFPYKIVVLADSSISSYSELIAAYGVCFELTIECRNGATLDMTWNGRATGINIPKINLVNANIVINQTGTSGQPFFGCTELNINNSTIVADNLLGELIHADTVAITNGSNVNATSAGQVIGVTSKLEVTDSSLTAYRKSGGGSSGGQTMGAVTTATGEITFTNSTIDIQHTNPTNSHSSYANALYISGAGKLTINSGDVNLMSNSYTNTGGLKLGSGALGVINGGTVFMGNWHALDNATSNGGAQIAADANLVINGGHITFQSGRPAITGPWTYNGGTVVLHVNRWNKRQACSELPTFGISEYTVRSSEVDGTGSAVVSDLSVLTTEQYWPMFTITEGVLTESTVTLPNDVVLNTSNADNSVSYAKTDADGNVTAGDASNWNIKLEVVNNIPTLTLKNATIGKVTGETWSLTSAPIVTAKHGKLRIVVEANSTITANATVVSGTATDLTIESVGGAKLTLVNHGNIDGGLSVATITLKNANLEMNTTKQWGKCIKTTTLNIEGGNVVINGKGYEYNKQFLKAAIVATNLNISGGAKVTVTNDVTPAVIANNTVISGESTVVDLESKFDAFNVVESLVLNGGTLNVFATSGQGSGTHSGVLLTETGDITVNGGTLNVDRVKNGNYMHGIWIKGAGSLTVNGGTVVANSGSANNRYGLYLQAGGTATINGGNVTINGYDHRPLEYDEEGTLLNTTNYAMGNGAIYAGEGSSVAVTGGMLTLRSGVTPMVGPMTISGGEVILISHKWTDRQFFTVAPVLPENVCISMSNAEALDGSDPIGSSADMLAKVQAYQYCRIGAHAEGEKQQEIIKAPTCNTPGSASEIVRCQHCHKLISSSDSVEVPATGVHTPGEVVIENIVAPGVTTNGSHDEVTYCKDCGTETSRNTVVDEAVGNRPAIIVETVTVAPGTKNVVVKVSISNNPGIISAQLLVGYDADKLELVSYADGKLLNGWTTHASAELSNNPAMFTWDDSLAIENNTANGVILTLTFNVKEGATGNAVITVSYDPENFFNYDLENVEFAPVNGGIDIQEHVHAYDKVTVVPPTETEQGYTLHECECGASYKDNYTDPVPPAVVDVNNVDGWFTVTNNDEANTDWLISVFFLGENSIEDPVKDFAEMVEFGKLYPDMNGMNGYRMYNGLQQVLITRAGNYVVRVRYTDADGNVQLIGKCFTVETVATRVNIVNNKVILTGLPENPQTIISVYYLGDQNVSADNYGAVGNAGKLYPEINGENGFRQYSSVNAIYLGNVGNYAIRATYVPAGGGARELLTLNFSIDQAAPGLTVADNKLTVNGIPAGATNLSVGVFFLGNKGVDNPATEWNALVNIGKENPVINSAQGYRTYKDASAVYLGNLGNYAIRVSYKDAEGNTVLLAEQFLIDSVIPGLTVANNKLTAQGFPAGSNPTFSVFYLGEETVPEPGSDAAWNQLLTIGKKHEAINTTAGFRSYTNPNVVYLNNIGNYVIRASYTAGGARKTVAAQLYIDTVVPGINVSDNRVSLVGVPYTSTITMSVVYIGDNTITDPIAEWNTIQALGRNYKTENGDAGIRYFSNHNDIFLGYTGNWVIRLVLKNSAGVVTDIAATQVTVDSISTIPTMTVTNGKLSVGNLGSNSIVGFSVFYLGENQLIDTSDWNTLVATGKLFPQYNDPNSGYTFYGSLNTVKFPATGNYVIRLAYNDADGVRQTSAIQQIVTVK